MIGMEEFEVPDVAEPIRALRAFAFKEFEDGTTVLRSMNGTMWPPNGTGKRAWHACEFLTAVCSRVSAFDVDDDDQFTIDMLANHPCPCPAPDTDFTHAGMGCGLYTFKTVADLSWEYPLWHMPSRGHKPWTQNIVVWGEVDIWGHVYEHERGYRAEFAQLRKLYHVPGYGFSKKKIIKLAEIYGVDWETMEFPRDEVGVIHQKRMDSLHHEGIGVPAVFLLLLAVGLDILVDTAKNWWKLPLKEKIIGRDRESREGEAAGGSGPSAQGADQGTQP